MVNANQLTAIYQVQEEDFSVIRGILPSGDEISLGRYAHKADCDRVYQYIRDSLSIEMICI